MNEKLENLKLNPGDDTDDWINKMEGYRRELRENHNLEIDEDQFIIQFLQNIPKGFYN